MEVELDALVEVAEYYSRASPSKRNQVSEVRLTFCSGLRRRRVNKHQRDADAVKQVAVDFELVNDAVHEHGRCKYPESAA